MLRGLPNATATKLAMTKRMSSSPVYRQNPHTQVVRTPSSRQPACWRGKSSVWHNAVEFGTKIIFWVSTTASGVLLHHPKYCIDRTHECLQIRRSRHADVLRNFLAMRFALSAMPSKIESKGKVEHKKEKKEEEEDMKAEIEEEELPEWMWDEERSSLPVRQDVWSCSASDDVLFCKICHF